jgi:hypothetical protein
MEKGKKTVKRAINWDPWMIAALEEFGSNNGKDFSESVRYLVECELVDRGYTRKRFEPGIVDGPNDKGEKAGDTASKMA